MGDFMKKPRKQLSAAKKFLLQITASLFLFALILVSKTYAPHLFGYIKSNLTYTPDLSIAAEAVKTFILRYTP